MAQNGDSGYQINGKTDARDYYWAGSDGRARRAYSTAYAGARTPDNVSDKGYMRAVARGGENYDQGRMSQDADAETARIARRQPTRTLTKRTPPKAAAKRK